MWTLRSKRKLLEKLSNSPTQQLIGRRGGIREVLNLREPSIDELDDLLEGMVQEAISTYSKKIDELDNLVNRFQQFGISITDFRLFKPYLGSICNFIAGIADIEKIDKQDAGQWIRENITPAQFIGCINKIMYLLDIEELYGNFSDALARIDGAVKRAKK
jgi:hypothetical protein